MGWGKRTYFNRRANEQTGITTGFASGVLSFPAEKLDVIVLTNVQTQFAGRAVKDIAGIVLGEKPVVLPEPKFCELERVDQATVLGKFVSKDTGQMEIVKRKSGLFYRWGESQDYRYLAPVSEKELYARDEFALWRWTTADSMTWEGPYGKLEFKRVR
jgi:hypothetical protein